MTMPTAAPRYIPQIDSLRAFAVLAVLVFHLSSEWLPGGFAGVDIFFVISGYVVSAALARSETGAFGPFARRFYAKRILRIVPALLVCLIATALLTVAFIPESWLSRANYTTILLAIVGLSNFSLMGADDGYFSPRADFNPATHTWSLGVEEQFYLIFPAICFIWLRAQHQGRSVWSSSVLPTAMLASFAYAAYASVNAPQDAYYSMPTRFWELGAGAVLFQLHQSGRYIGRDGVRNGLTLLASFALLGIAIAFSNETLFPVPWGFPATVGSLLFIDAVVARSGSQSTLMRVLGASPLVAIGRISYSLYLWHWPVVVGFKWTVGLESVVQYAAAVAIVFALAIASHRYIERPIRYNPALLRRPAGHVIAGGLACVLMAFALTFSAIGARPALTLSVTGSVHDWYSTPWPIDAAPPLGGCPATATSRGLSGGTVHEFLHGKCSMATNRQIFVVGDSHAGALMTLLSKYAQSDASDVRIYLRVDCSFLRLRAANEDAQCAEFGKSFTDELQERAQPGDIVLLPSLRINRLANQWGGSLANERALSDPEEDLRGRDEAEAWLRAIAPLEVSVMFMAPTPIFAAPAFRCSDWFNRDNPICRPGLSVERDMVQQLRAPALDAMRELVLRHSNVSIWDPFDVLCPEPRCTAFRGGRPLFFDGDHLSGYGNLLIYASFKAAVSSWREPAADVDAGRGS